MHAPSSTPTALRVLSFTLLIGIACGDGAAPEPPGPPATMAFSLESRNQQAVVGELVAVDPTIVILDASSRPVPDIGVLFSATGNGEVDPTLVRTDAQGRATVQWRLSTIAGRNDLTAETLELGITSLMATGVAGEPAQSFLTGVPASGLSLGVEQTHTISIVAVDAYGNPVQNAPATFVSQNEAVATVSPSGVVTGRSPGSTSIIVTAAGSQHTVSVTVLSRVAGIAGTPWGIGIAPNSQYVLVTRPENARLEHIVLPQLTRGTPIVTELRPVDVVIGPDGVKAYVMNMDSHTMTAVNTTTGEQIGSVPIPNVPRRVRVHPSGSTIYALSANGGLLVIDAMTFQVRRTLAASGNGLALSPTGDRVYASNEDGRVFRGNPETGDVATVGVGGRPQEVVVAANGAELWIANESGWVDLLDAATLEQIDRVSVPHGLFGMDLTPDGSQLWAISPTGSAIYVIGRATRSIVRIVPLSGRPRRIVFDAAGGRALVTNEHGWVDAVQINP